MLAARGDLDGALAGYADLTARLPGPSYLLEYAELLRVAGHDAQADEQMTLADAAQRLFTANGGRDGLATAALALAQDRPADAVTAARAEWARRQHPDVADTLAWALHAAGRDTEALGYAKRAVGRRRAPGRIRLPPRHDLPGPRPDGRGPHRVRPGARHQPRLLAHRRADRPPRPRRPRRHPMNARIAVLAAGAITALAGVLAWPAPAQAHPISNFSVNQYRGLTLRPDRIDVVAAVDVAEIPTLQEKPRVDTDHDGTLSPAERSAYAAAECDRLADGFSVTVQRAGLKWTITDPAYVVTPGAAGLETSRLGCRLSAPVALQDQATVRVENRYQSGRIGWHEISAAVDGVRLLSSSVPAESISDELHSYPKDLLTSAPDVRSATIRTGGAGEGGAAGPAANPVRGSTSGPAWLVAAQRHVESVLGGKLTPLVIGLAFLLAILLGAGHAALPGHGKTVMAAYFAGRRGRIRDALAVGGTVTLAHTGGVLLVGLLLSTSTALAGERLLAWLGAASGVLVAAVGLGMLVSALRARRAGRADAHGTHGHTHGPHGHSHGPHSHTHDPHGHTHSAHGHTQDSHGDTHDQAATMTTPHGEPSTREPFGERRARRRPRPSSRLRPRPPARAVARPPARP